MRSLLAYRLSLGLSVILTLLAFITLLGSLAELMAGVGRASFLSLLPWKPIVLVGLAGLNCTLRARLILRRKN
jgi:hypothetical protein